MQDVVSFWAQRRICFCLIASVQDGPFAEYNLSEAQGPSMILTRRGCHVFRIPDAKRSVARGRAPPALPVCTYLLNANGSSAIRRHPFTRIIPSSFGPVESIFINGWGN
ncbi:MAG: hypothetical protein ACRD3T_21995, partial [Terriglobia bacterium]